MRPDLSAGARARSQAHKGVEADSGMQGERAKKAKRAGGNGMTEEEMLKIQEELFAKSRARMDAGGGDAPPPPSEAKAEAE